jgi:acyl-CoA synthetase (AMP-forming)/AMP-acid ligase II
VSALANGIRVVYPSLLPDTLMTMKAIESERCTSIKGPPTIYIDLINHPERNKFNLSSLESMLIGASTVPQDLLLKIKKELNLKHIIIG